LPGPPAMGGTLYPSGKRFAEVVGRKGLARSLSRSRTDSGQQPARMHAGTHFAPNQCGALSKSGRLVEDHRRLRPLRRECRARSQPAQATTEVALQVFLFIGGLAVALVASDRAVAYTRALAHLRQRLKQRAQLLIRLRP
jgi:hypothetical protein